MNVNNKYCVIIEDVYGVPFAALSAPQGYEFTGEFRPLEQGDCWLSPSTRKAAHNANRDHDCVRLILRAIPTVESVYDGQTLEQLKEKAKTAVFFDDKNLKFEWTGEFRKVQKGDYFLCATSGYDVLLNGAHNYYCFTGQYRLIMRKCPIIKEIYGKELSELTLVYIYGPVLPKVPAGYRVVGFRPPIEGELYLSAYEGCPEVATSSFDRPRLILSPLGPR